MGCSAGRCAVGGCKTHVSRDVGKLNILDCRFCRRTKGSYKTTINTGRGSIARRGSKNLLGKEAGLMLTHKKISEFFLRTEGSCERTEPTPHRTVAMYMNLPWNLPLQQKLSRRSPVSLPSSESSPTRISSTCHGMSGAVDLHYGSREGFLLMFVIDIQTCRIDAHSGRLLCTSMAFCANREGMFRPGHARPKVTLSGF